jgi:hypothetical protein
MNQFVNVMAYLMGLMALITLTHVFGVAAMNGGETLVHIDVWGEQEIELLLLFAVVWPIMTLGGYGIITGYLDQPSPDATAE